MTRVQKFGGGLALCAAVLLTVAALEPALAQARHPFAVGSGEGAASAGGGLAGLILAWQSRFHTQLQGAARALASDPAAFWTLAAASFSYGVFHAAGPGHGKAVLASYMLANETALRRGLVLAALAAVLQGGVAIALVGAAALLFHATAARMNDAARWMEIASYAAIALLGARLVLVKGRSFLAAMRVGRATPAGRFVCVAADDPDHVHSAGCGHLHAPDPKTLGAPLTWRSAAAAVVAAGLRPCSGAILVLVFTLAQGRFAAGAAAVGAMSVGTAITTGALAALAVFAKGAAMRLSASDAGRTQLVARGAELAAALAVLFVGLGLLLGIGLSASGA